MTDSKNTADNQVEQVALRKIETYQTDDGRRIDVVKKIGEVDMDLPPNATKEEVMSLKFVEMDEYYIGIASIGMPGGMSSEVKFEMDVKSVEEGMKRFYEFAGPAAENFIHSIMQQEQEAEQSRIIQAPAGMAQALKEQEGSIIQP